MPWRNLQRLCSRCRAIQLEVVFPMGRLFGSERRESFGIYHLIVLPEPLQIVRRHAPVQI